MRIRPSLFAALAPLSLSASLLAQTIPPAVKAAEASIDGEKIRAHVNFLADDLLEGRGPGLRGSEIAAKYIATQFALYGLKPGGDNGTYLQQINFVGMKAIPDKTTFVARPAEAPRRSDGASCSTPTTSSTATTTPSPTAPSPPPSTSTPPSSSSATASPRPSSTGTTTPASTSKAKSSSASSATRPPTDPAFFGGNALTYYGRWTYKFEQAARMGAIGALIIHRTDLASYGWDVVKNSNTSEKTYLRDDKDPQLEAASWIQLDVAKQIFKSSNLDPDAEIIAAGKRGFKAIELPVRLHAHVESTVRPFQSPNVVGILPAAGAPAKDQAVLYTAHFDHLGFVPGMAGDNIYNGAADNATGCGMLLEMARAWCEAAHPASSLPHSVIFASVTAEEQGLLGSEYLGQHPPIPAGQIALDINYDMILPIGVPLETNVNGAQRTNFFPTVEATAKRFNLAIVPDPQPLRRQLLPLRPLLALPRRHPRLLHRNRQPLRRPRRSLGQKAARRLHRPRLSQLHRQLHAPTGTSPATPNSPASAWSWAGKPSPPPPP